MKTFSFLIKGKNLLIHFDGTPQKLGFFATRVINAENEHEAQRIAIKKINNEISSIILNGQFDVPVISIEKNNIDLYSDDSNHRGIGFTWFKDK